MGVIKVLPEIIANRIAAGEVIERPASIAKELIENSLDAGAKTVEITIRHGGKSLIRITDDGIGMTPEDAELAFVRHATSKIQVADDLNSIHSFGFRGEALPSIGAVSRVTMKTRVKDAAEGVEVVIEGGVTKSVKPCGCKAGTTIEIRDLFFNTPARRKFMKTDNTELGHLTDTVSNIALSRLDSRFVFKSADRTVFDVVAGETLQRRAASVLGDDLSRHMIEIEGEANNIRVSGIIGKPHCARANRNGQTLFINGRWVKSFSFSYALQAGYHGLLMHGQYPIAVLNVEVDPGRVDVNVHPTKQEVRISNESQIKTLIKETVSEALSKETDMAPPVVAPRTPYPSLQDAWKSTGSSSQPATQKSWGDAYTTHKAAASMTPTFQVKTPEPLQETITVREKLRITKVLGQIHGTFILAETEEGLVIIDQHAAHEKVQFETLMRAFNSGSPVSQRLLMDEMIEFKPGQKEDLEEALPLLRKLGFDLDFFGDNTLVVRALPATFEKEHPEQLLRSFLEQREAGHMSTDLERHQEEIAALVACKRKSVKAHDAMTAESMQSLLEQLAQCDNPFSCPHGRPSFLNFTFDELEKQFKRKL